MIFFLKEKYVVGSTEYILAKYSETNYEYILTHSMNEVANVLHIHPSTLTRAVKKLGFSKYSLFRNYILKKADEYGDMQPILQQKNFDQQISTIYKSNRFVIDKTFDSLNLDDFEKVINLIVSSKRIITFGLGFSGYLGTQLAKYLRLIGMECIDLTNIYDLIKFASANKVSGTWIIFSRTLTTKEVTFGIKKILENNQNEVIVVTNQNAKIPSKIKYKILFNSLDEIDSYFQLSSKLSLLFIINLLIVGILSKKEIVLSERVEEFNLNTNLWKGHNR